MALVKRTTKGSKLTIAEMDDNLDFLNLTGGILKMYTNLNNINFIIDSNTGQIRLPNAPLFAGTSGFDLTQLDSTLVSRIQNFNFPIQVTVSSITGFNLLTNLSDVGTGNALDCNSNAGFTNTLIDDLFTQLPSTTATATIRVQGCPGAATCTPSIATAKGYVVIT